MNSAEISEDPFKRIPLLVLVLGLVVLGVIVFLSYEASIPHTHTFQVSVDSALGCPWHIVIVTDSHLASDTQGCETSRSWQFVASQVNVTVTAATPSADTIFNIYKDGAQCAHLQAGDHGTVPPRYPQTVTGSC